MKYRIALAATGLLVAMSAQMAGGQACDTTDAELHRRMRDSVSEVYARARIIPQLDSAGRVLLVRDVEALATALAARDGDVLAARGARNL